LIGIGGKRRRLPGFPRRLQPGEPDMFRKDKGRMGGVEIRDGPAKAAFPCVTRARTWKIGPCMRKEPWA
jgi:hypothetical protein